MTPPFASVVSLPPFARPEQFDPPRLLNVSPLSLIPDANVEVAVVVEILRADACSPARKVEVPMIPWE